MKRILSLVVSISILMMCFLGMTLIANAAEVLVTNAAEFGAMMNTTSGTYSITSNITINITNATELTTYLGAGNTTSNKFVGSITGKLGGVAGAKPTITINVNLPTEDRLGLVRVLGSGGSVSNIIVEGSITGRTQVGGIVGYASGGSITNCENKATISAAVSGKVAADVGGILGTAAGYTVTITGCSNYGNVSAPNVDPTRGNVGGIAGLMSKATTTALISGCYNSGSITSTGRCVGGILGNGACKVTLSANTGNIYAGENFAGGVVGYHSGMVTKSYNTGNVTATNTAGGIVGFYNPATASNAIEISDCYNSGAVEATGQAGGLSPLIGCSSVATTITRNYNIGAVTAYSGSTVMFHTVAGSTQTVNSNYYLNSLTALLSPPDSIMPTPLTDANMQNLDFNSPDVWKVNKLDPYGYYYPQLIDNPPRNANLTLLGSPSNLSVTDGTGTATLSFTGTANAVKYKALITNGTEETIFYTAGTETQIDITSAVQYNGSYDIKLIAIGNMSTYGNSETYAQYAYNYTTGKQVTVTSSGSGTVDKVGTVYLRNGLTYTITVTPSVGYVGVISVNGTPIVTDIFEENIYETSPINANTTIAVVFSERPVTPVEQIVFSNAIKTFIPAPINEAFTIKNQDVNPFQIKVGEKYGVTLSIVDYYYGWTLQECGVEYNGVKYKSLINPIEVDSESGKYGILFEGINTGAVRPYATYVKGTETITVYGNSKNIQDL